VQKKLNRLRIEVGDCLRNSDKVIVLGTVAPHVLHQLESKFLTRMDDYLKKDLGVKSLIIGTNDHIYLIPGMPLVRTIEKFDLKRTWDRRRIWRTAPTRSETIKGYIALKNLEGAVGMGTRSYFPERSGEELIPLALNPLRQ
jgi:hypothetical protein